MLSKVKPLIKIDEGDENADLEVELVPADLNSKNNQISQVKIITENGQTPIINEVRDLRSFINENHRRARDRLLNANREGLTIYSDDEFSGFQLNDHEVDVPNICPDDNRPRTISQGPVEDLPWTLP